VNALKAKHDAIQRGVKKSERTKFPITAVEEIALRFNQSHADGFVYVAAFSFCSPSSIQMASNDVLHAISASDAAHGFLGGCHMQTNMLDAAAQVVPVMTTVSVLNESKNAWRMHYEALAEAHSKVAPHELSDPGLTSDETPFNTWRHHMVMDGNAGGCLAFAKTFPEANLVPCSRHMASNVKTVCGAQAKREYFEGLKAPTKPALKQVWDRWRASTDPGVKKMVSYFDSRAPPDNDKIHLFPAKSEIRGMNTSNIVESTNGADKPARALPLDRAVSVHTLTHTHTRTHTHTHTHTHAHTHIHIHTHTHTRQVLMFAELQRARFLNNQSDAVGRAEPLPPRKQAALDLVKIGALKVTTVVLNDPRYPKVGASVLTLSGKSHVLSNIAQDYGGMNSMQDATCECSEPSTRKYGLPCVHNLAHAEKAGLTPESIVHWKDTTLAWKRAYDGLEWPVLSMVNVDTSVLVNPMVQYPPVVAPKCGRPVRVRRIMGAEEAARKQMRVRAVPHCGACQKWGHTSRSKLCALFKKK
jgi:hypothetical protein